MLFHAILLIVKLPDLYGEVVAPPPPQKVFVVQQVRFKPPPPPDGPIHVTVNFTLQ